ncbi:MAG TPA: UDP-glucose 4-epimerase GalE [Cytophagaceae bacterium]|jgi:UDP-glucose 4-epimerase|nr:UDP-glucose 4-epimerase GalE [Cytophagaceae bacterium]
MTSIKTLLVTGGAGYIGSHTVRLLADKGYKIIVVDNMIYGHEKAIINEEVILEKGDLGDTVFLERIFSNHTISAVLHFAAYASVGESIQEPAKYYQNNLASPLVLLETMRKYSCHYFIFSSTCATYGNPQYIPMDEKHPQNPINPYGQSKLMLEKVIIDYEKAYGMKYVFLRYFNASGAAEDGKTGEDHTPETHLIPLVLQAASGLRKSITVFGTDYDTPDGSCVRDYIHVSDLAEAHLLALTYLTSGKPSIACNLGTGKGYSVKEVIGLVEEVTGLKVPVEYGERRPGDPPRLVAEPSLAKEKLGWVASYQDLKDVIRTAWIWHNNTNKGRY